MYLLGLVILSACLVPSQGESTLGDCRRNDFTCYERALAKEAEIARVVASPYTKPELYVVCAMHRNLTYCLEAEYCDAYKGPIPEDIDGLFELLCADYEYENGTTWPCTYDTLIRAHNSLCMAYYLLNNTADCDELTWGLTCAYRLANDRCGESSAEFLNKLRVKAFSSYIREHDCTSDLSSVNILGLSVGMMCIAFIFIPLVIRFTWCPPNFRKTHDIEVANRMIINWKEGM